MKVNGNLLDQELVYKNDYYKGWLTGTHLCADSDNTVIQRQTAVTTYFSSKQLLLIALEWHQPLVSLYKHVDHAV